MTPDEQMHEYEKMLDAKLTWASLADRVTWWEWMMPALSVANAAITFSEGNMWAAYGWCFNIVMWVIFVRYGKINEVFRELSEARGDRICNAWLEHKKKCKL